MLNCHWTAVHEYVELYLTQNDWHISWLLSVERYKAWDMRLLPLSPSSDWKATGLAVGLEDISQKAGPVAFDLLLADLLAWRTENLHRHPLTTYPDVFMMKSEMFTKPSAQPVLRLAHQTGHPGKFNFPFIKKKKARFYFVEWLCSVEETLEDQTLLRRHCC